MTTYIITPKPINPDRANAILGISKITSIETAPSYPTIRIITNSPLTQIEANKLRAELDKLYPFGWDETVS